jgi:calcium-dependent protein kinase
MADCSLIVQVAQCHAKNVIYRDIKPDNFLFLNNTQNSPLKATDFGLATYFRPGEVLF